MQCSPKLKGILIGLICTMCLSMGWSIVNFSWSKSNDPDEILLDIQKELLELDKEFEVIRKDLFFPNENEVLFYLRNNLKEEVRLQTIDLFINGRKIHHHTYTESETIAFQFSDLQPVFRTELQPGRYRMRARIVTGKGNGRIWEHQFNVTKENLPRFVEIDLSFDRKNKKISLSETVH